MLGKSDHCEAGYLLNKQRIGFFGYPAKTTHGIIIHGKDEDCVGELLYKFNLFNKRKISE